MARHTYLGAHRRCHSRWGVLFWSSCLRRMRRRIARTLLSSPTCCARIEWWIGSLPIGRPSLQSAPLSSRCSGGLSHYYAGLDRSLNARVSLSEPRGIEEEDRSEPGG